MKIKIIDLLNKIAKGEEIPKKIEYRNIKFLYDKSNQLYIVENYNEYNDLLMELSNHKGTDLNYEVEILEEDTPTKDKKIKRFYFSVYDYNNNEEHTLKQIENKFNEIIDKINGEENE